MNADQIRELMTGRKPRSDRELPKNYAFFVDEDGKLTRPRDEDGKLLPVKASQLGSFTGKAGTVARSRKGRTYRKPNGTRRYAHENAVAVAYKITPA